jgi:DtxR family Mn-dependent transcriptional regulator
MKFEIYAPPVRLIMDAIKFVAPIAITRGSSRQTGSIDYSAWPKKNRNIRNKLNMEDHKDHALEELLEALYKAREDGRGELKLSELPLPTAPSKADLQSFDERKLVNINDGRIALAPGGLARAELLVRRHRLAERLFSEILELRDSSLHSASCSFEHILDPAVTESVCTMLGHPPTCPHGKRIPPGECCRKSRKELAPIVIPLKDLAVGSEARIVFMATPHHQRLGRLVNLGVVPGGRITLKQKRPSYLLRIGSTEIAVDGQIAGEIYVKRL